MTRRECIGARMRSGAENNLFILPVAYYATYCVTEERSRSSHVRFLKVPPAAVRYVPRWIARYRYNNGGLF